MKGLLLKDWLVIVKQTKVYFLLMFLFALVPGMGIYSIFFGALLPMTALAYDERSKWGQMAKMMPYSDHKMVAEKYLFGYLLAGGIAVLEAVIQILYFILGIGEGELLQNMGVIIISVMALQLPVIFRMGVEKSRIFLMFVTISVMFGLQSYFSVRVFEGGVSRPEWSPYMMPEIFAITLIIQFVSVMLSERLYGCAVKKKN